MWPVVEGFNILNLALSLFLGAYLHEAVGLSLGSLSAYIFLLQGFFKPLKTILERYNQLQNSLASADRVFHLLEEPAEIIDGTAFPPQRLQGEIEFKNLTFRYSEKSPYVLHNVNLKVPPHSSLALVGRTGSGKSTMVALLQKFHELDQGDITIDGLSLREISPKALRPRVGVVQQDGFVFSGSIYANISLFNPEVTVERAIWAAEQAQLHEVLRKHGGLNGWILERGANLSAGERQLLAFARVLAFDPDILILDEATANIDSLSEQRIQKATENVTRDRTSIIIAHRLSTILHCDQVAVLDHGRLSLLHKAQSGTVSENITRYLEQLVKDS
jgi:ATP-binding cassette subfamily B protein